MKKKKKDTKKDSHASCPTSGKVPLSPGPKSHKSRKDHSSQAATPLSPNHGFKSGLDEALSKRSSTGSATLPAFHAARDNVASNPPFPLKKMGSHDELKCPAPLSLQPSPPIIPSRRQSVTKTLPESFSTWREQQMSPPPPTPPPMDYRDESPSSPPPMLPPRDFDLRSGNAPPPLPSSKNKPKVNGTIGPPPLPSSGSKPQLRSSDSHSIGMSNASSNEQEDHSGPPRLPLSGKPHLDRGSLNGPPDRLPQQAYNDPPPLPPGNTRPPAAPAGKPLPLWATKARSSEQEGHVPPLLPMSGKPQLDRSPVTSLPTPPPDKPHQQGYNGPPPLPPGTSKPSVYPPPPAKPLPPVPNAPAAETSTQPPMLPKPSVSSKPPASLPPKPLSTRPPPPPTGAKPTFHDSHQHAALNAMPPRTPAKPSTSAKPMSSKPALPPSKPSLHNRPQLKPQIHAKPGSVRQQSSSDSLAHLVAMKDKVATKATDIMTRRTRPASRHSENLQERFDAFSSSVSALLDKADDITDSHVVVSSKSIQSKLMEYRNLTRRAGGCPSEDEMAQICSATDTIMSLVNDMFR